MNNTIPYLSTARIMRESITALLLRVSERTQAACHAAKPIHFMQENGGSQ